MKTEKKEELSAEAEKDKKENTEDEKGVDTLSTEEQLKLVLDELESLREENEKLKNKSTELENKNTDQFERLKSVLLGRKEISIKDIEKEKKEREIPTNIPADYWTKDLDLS